MNTLIEKALKNESIIENSWKGFAIKVIPKGAPENQFVEMRKAYYAGFYSCFDLMTIISSELSEGEAEKMLTKIQNWCETEIRKFF